MEAKVTNLHKYKIEIDKTFNFLNKGAIILYPTDTVWGIGCDATNEASVAKIYQIKQREESKSLIILVDSLAMLKTIITDIPENALDQFDSTARPTTVIFNNPKGLAKNLVAKDNTVAIRIVQDEFCQHLIKEFNKPIVSTSANISGDVTPMSFKEINPLILDAVDYVVNLRQDEISKQASRIVKLLDDGSTLVLRD